MPGCSSSNGPASHTDGKCAKDDCLLRKGLDQDPRALPKEVCAPDVSIDIAVVDQGVPNVDISTPDSIINLAPLPITYKQLHSLFYNDNDQFGFNHAALSSEDQSVWMNTKNPFVPWDKNNDQQNDGTYGIRNLDLVSFDRQHYFDTSTSSGEPVLKKFNLFDNVMKLYRQCLGDELCWNPCAKVEFQKYIGTLKTLFDIGDVCDKSACSLTLDELFSMLDTAGYKIEPSTGMPYARGNEKFPKPDKDGDFALNIPKTGYSWSSTQEDPPGSFPSRKNPYKFGGKLSGNETSGTPSAAVEPQNRNKPNNQSGVTVDASGNSVPGHSHPPLTSMMPQISIIVVLKSCTPGVSDMQVRFNYLIDFQPANQYPLVTTKKNGQPLPTFKYPKPTISYHDLTEEGMVAPHPKMTQFLNYWRETTPKARYSCELPSFAIGEEAYDDLAAHIQALSQAESVVEEEEDEADADEDEHEASGVEKARFSKAIQIKRARIDELVIIYGGNSGQVNTAPDSGNTLNGGQTAIQVSDNNVQLDVQESGNTNNVSGGSTTIRADDVTTTAGNTVSGSGSADATEQ
jgi:hypothetical protein